MTTDTYLPAALKEIAEERAALRDQIRVLQERENALARAEAGLRLLVPDQPRLDFPPAPEATESPMSRNGTAYPRTREAVLEVLKGREGKQLTARAITRHAQEQGLLDPGLKRPYGTILEAAKRLEASDQRIRKRHRKGQLWFSYRSPGSTESGEDEPEGGES